jgi:ParB/RepB/Spo0J family partition protein
MGKIGTVPRGRLTALATQPETTHQPGQIVLRIPVDAITPNPHQSRRTFAPNRLEELAGSVRLGGVRQPVLLTQIAPGEYELVYGERRWRAAKMVGLMDVPALIEEKNLDDFEKLRLALIENLDREDITPSDEARGIAWLVDRSSAQKVAEGLSRSKQWVSKRVRIAKAPEFVLEFAASGAVGDLEALYELAKLADDNPEEAQRAIANYAPGSHLREQVKAAQRQASDDLGGDDDSAGDDDPAGDAGHEAEHFSPDARRGSEMGEPDLARSGAGPRGGGNSGDVEGEVSHAKHDKGAAAKPMRIEAVLRRGGEIILVTEDGKIRVEFSAKAKQQLAKILDTD